MTAATFVVFGSGGQVGRALAETPLPEGWQLREIHRGQADITDSAAVTQALNGVQRGLVVNAAAYTAVDKAESEPDAAFAINGDGAGILAAAAAKAGLPMVHISTDYVFDGRKTSPYVESDPVAPLSVYGTSKLAGEMAVREANPRHVILRTSWIFGSHGNNFLKTMLRLGCEREMLRVVDDQTGCPTAAADLAAAIIALGPRLVEAEDGFGTFHYAGDEPTTWFGFAHAILASAARRGYKVAETWPIPTTEYPLPAPRPAYSVMSCQRLMAAHGLSPSPWRIAVERCLDQLLETKS